MVAGLTHRSCSLATSDTDRVGMKIAFVDADTNIPFKASRIHASVCTQLYIALDSNQGKTYGVLGDIWPVSCHRLRSPCAARPTHKLSSSTRSRW